MDDVPVWTSLGTARSRQTAWRARLAAVDADGLRAAVAEIWSAALADGTWRAVAEAVAVLAWAIDHRDDDIGDDAVWLRSTLQAWTAERNRLSPDPLAQLAPDDRLRSLLRQVGPQPPAALAAILPDLLDDGDDVADDATANRRLDRRLAAAAGQASFGDLLAAEGVTTVGLDDDGITLVVRRADGTVRPLP